MLKQLVPYAKGDANVRQYFIDSMEKVVSISNNKTLNDRIQEQIESIDS